MSEGASARVKVRAREAEREAEREDEREAPGDPAESAIAKMTELPVALECDACGKSNHVGVPQCVFCGVPFQTAAYVSAASVADVDEAQASTEPPPPSRAVPVSTEPPPIEDDEIHSAPVADPLIGVVVADRYRILDPLGRGGMGIVYKVEHTRIGKLLAMKLLTGELSRNRDVVRRFKQEALTASKLSSPNTVQVFDFGASEGLTYLVMELVTGADLGRVLRVEGPLPFARLGKIIVQVCSSLAEAHQKGIVHRDIKPENIMLMRARDGGEVAKVLDFGLAKLREGEGLNDVTSQGAIVGTPYFMAPEQIRAEEVDARTDIYSLGALMYRALTGTHPFGGATPMAVFAKHLSEAAIPPDARAPDRLIPPGVSRLVLRMLSKDPAGRPQRVEEVQDALVKELRALGTASVDDLLDSAQLREMSRVAPSPRETEKAEIATRDELEAYERKLRRKRWGAMALVPLIVAGAAFVGLKGYLANARSFHGVEAEPNDASGDATEVPFGSTVRGMLGKRMDATRSDRDFYAITVPAPAAGGPAHVKLAVSALPNMAMCTMLYSQGFSTALGQYCVGRVGRDLEIPALRLEPGRYLVAVLQDMDTYGKAPVYVQENVSDVYRLAITASAPEAGREVEPNDQVASANEIAPGAPIKATIGWARDADVYCVGAEVEGAIRFRVDDAIRDRGVLEVTPISSAGEGAPVRLHAGGRERFTAADAKLPWQSKPLPSQADAPRCLRVRLTSDPWSSDQAGVIPSGGSEEYVVEVEAVP